MKSACSAGQYLVVVDEQLTVNVLPALTDLEREIILRLGDCGAHTVAELAGALSEHGTYNRIYATCYRLRALGLVHLHRNGRGLEVQPLARLVHER